MRSLTRKEFLALAGAAAVGTALTGGGCGGAQDQPPPLNSRRSPSPSASDGKGRATRPRLSVARGTDTEAITVAAVAGLGGMERFVRSGDDVIIKPNICTGYHGPEYAATTNPIVVGTLVALCRRAGAGRVRVMDSPFGGPADEAYAVSGIAAATEEAGGIMEVMSPTRFQRFTIPEGRSITSWPIYRDILACDVLIDVPIVKDHGLTRMTLAGKNLLGVVLEPGHLHGEIGQRVADLVSVCRPTLTVIDAVRMLVANGPTGGDLGDVERRDTVAVSADSVAADSFAATLFGLTGHEIPTVAAEARMGLGEIDLDKVAIRTQKL
jgi:uncharacterized protein (DUF362 family)